MRGKQGHKRRHKGELTKKLTLKFMKLWYKNYKKCEKNRSDGNKKGESKIVRNNINVEGSMAVEGTKTEGESIRHPFGVCW